jgi:hypothetical protein
MFFSFVSQHLAAQEIVASRSFGQVNSDASMNQNRNAKNTGGKNAQGATKVGPCLTDAAPKDRSQRTARISTAMMPPERMRRQSPRHSWPGGSIRTSMTATATTRILAQRLRLSREQTVAGSIRAISRRARRARASVTSLQLQLE